MKSLRFRITHEIYSIVGYIIGHRFKCPKCDAIGTWNPHGGIVGDSRGSGRRYLCKWCGYYIGQPFKQKEIIEREAFIDENYGGWRIIDWYEGARTPRDAYIPKDKIKANPWKR